ncbi:hypothetical protein Smp_126070 [Schistosoma mansoni]|uniref:hypothetical protein n=1 Tax=Schistosoma mansoni TaxID=6183 RepID=UPI0001A63F98|nr:hypothetical protein Smp_126070 [Schistosoma mansoni]|eukprot:XP_018648462.1 hypothetical protein Smp_126070 [Schistosoma mansoni]
MCISTSAFRKYYRPEPKKPYLHSMKLKSPFGRPTRSSYLRSQLSYGHMDRGKIKNLRRDDSDILDCHTLIEPIHKLLTNSLVKQLSVKPTDLYSYLIGSQMVVKVKQEISKSLDFGKKIKPNYTRVGTQKSYENIISSGRAYSIPSISTERIKGILDDKLCIYGYQTGKTPRTSDFHELDDIAENRLHTLSYYNDNNQLKVPHKTSIRPKSAGDAHNGMNSVVAKLLLVTVLQLPAQRSVEAPWLLT